ncbi:carotenoid 9,10(9',10')-cleavage dioxygenase 1-like [Curcuma longa]|uniref:carotenoid 9,10(9',10')-cleavage dioxygenase 1-like n=1 Tax=Curcuma longa TaxID=136217 RepID=UPI003D9E9AAF
MESLSRSTVICSSRNPPHRPSPPNSLPSTSTFKPLLRRLKPLPLKVEVPDQLKTASLNLLDWVVETFFRFEKEPMFIAGNFAPVAEIGEAVQVSAIEGVIPEGFPQGIYLRNGPNHVHPDLTAAVSVFGRTAYTSVEGDGMIHATYFSKDGHGNWNVSYKNKYVETESFLLEKNRNKKLFLPAAGGDPSAVLASFFINTVRCGQAVKFDANTGVFVHAGKLYAVSEQNLPYEIDPSNLDTLKSWDVNGTWDRPFTSHPKRVPHTGELVTMGVDIQRPHFVLGVISADGTKMLHKVDLKFKTGVLIHELGVTENYNIIMDYPLGIGINRPFGGKPFIGYEQNGKSKIGVMPRFGNAESVYWFRVKNHCSFHIINTLEDGDEVVVRGCRTTGSVIPGPDHKANKPEWYRRVFQFPNEDSNTFDPSVDGSLFSRPYQWRLNMKTGAVTEAFLTGKEFAMDFPTINSRFVGLRNKYAYTQVVDSDASSNIGVGKFKMIAKLQFDLHDKDNEELIKVEYHALSEGQFCSGLEFVQNLQGTEEDDGWLISYVHDEKSNRSMVYIIDAKRFTEGPVARIELPQRVPYGFHGTYKYM